MGDQQCGLCLSCGVPFLPDVSRIELFNRAGVLSVLFLNNEYNRNPQISDMFEHHRFASERNQSHIFHESHHATALRYMCERHRDDADVGAGFVPAVNAVVPNQNNAPFLYLHAPGSKIFKNPQAAVWPAPPENERINLKRLQRFILNSTIMPNAQPIGHNLGQTVFTCMRCNLIMTQLADIRYLLGYRSVSRRNTNTPVITQRHIQQFPVNTHRVPLEIAYGAWTITNVPAAPVNRPEQSEQDSDAPHVAYYLHMCLPFRGAGAAGDWFTTDILNAGMRLSARKLYVEQSWLLLEIAALATLVERGKVTEPGGKLSHGMHQHYGVLDLYVSYFLFRLIEFRYSQQLHATGVDFVQWHQKYYCDAMNCRLLFTDNENQGIIAQTMYGTTDQDSQALIETLCVRLVSCVLPNGKLFPLVKHVVNLPNVPRQITQFFVPTETLRVLRARSRMVRAYIFLQTCVFGSLYFFLFSDAGHGLPGGAGQVRDQRALASNHPAVQGLPRGVSQAAPRLPVQLAVAGD